MEREVVSHFNKLFDLENSLTSADEWNYSIREGDISVKYVDSSESDGPIWVDVWTREAKNV
jgi:hypothetical protein